MRHWSKFAAALSRAVVVESSTAVAPGSGAIVAPPASAAFVIRTGAGATADRSRTSAVSTDLSTASPPVMRMRKPPGSKAASCQLRAIFSSRPAGVNLPELAS